jgi:hypothetical protein
MKGKGVLKVETGRTIVSESVSENPDGTSTKTTVKEFFFLPAHTDVNPIQRSLRFNTVMVGAQHEARQKLLEFRLGPLIRKTFWRP